MKWIDLNNDMRRIELRDGENIVVIAQRIDNLYVIKDNITRSEFTIEVGAKKKALKISKDNLIKKIESRLMENWVEQGEKLNKVVSYMYANKEIIVADYSLGQIVNVKEFDTNDKKYVIMRAKYKGICLEQGKILNMFESIVEHDVFMLPGSTDKVYEKHDAAVRECVRLNESLRKRR